MAASPSAPRRRLSVLQQQLALPCSEAEHILQLQNTSAQQQPCNDASMFAGQVVAITGAAKGIGEAAALAFARRGACLLLTDLDEAAVQATAARCRAAGSPKVRRCGACTVKQAWPQCALYSGDGVVW